MAIEQFIENEVKSNDVVLFMKGTPQFPMCGFSGQVVQILDHLGVSYKGLNVLESDDLREGIKSYSNWPTVPQLYVKGEFVGGCDIVREMFQAGELQGLEGRVRRRLRHCARNVPGGGIAGASQGQGRAGQGTRVDLAQPSRHYDSAAAGSDTLASQAAGRGCIPSSPVALIHFTPMR